MCSMTSDGSAYVRFKRALEIGNELLVVARRASYRASRSTTRSASASYCETAIPTGISEPPCAGWGALPWRPGM